MQQRQLVPDVIDLPSKSVLNIIFSYVVKWELANCLVIETLFFKLIIQIVLCQSNSSLEKETLKPNCHCVTLPILVGERK